MSWFLNRQKPAQYAQSMACILSFILWSILLLLIY